MISAAVNQQRYVTNTGLLRTPFFLFLQVSHPLDRPGTPTMLRLVERLLSDLVPCIHRLLVLARY